MAHVRLLLPAVLLPAVLVPAVLVPAVLLPSVLNCGPAKVPNRALTRATLCGPPLAMKLACRANSRSLQDCTMRRMIEESDHEASHPGRRERKKRATRLALKMAALDLVAERGFAHVTVEDIADAVDVSVRTFFNYFTSKEDALVGEDPEKIEAMRADLIGLPAELTPLEALRTVLFARVRAIGEDIDLSGEDQAVWLRRFAVVHSQPEVLSAYTKHLSVVENALTDALMERLGGDERLRAYASLVTTSAIGVLRVAGRCWGGAGGAPSLLEFTATAFDLLARGLALDSPSSPGDVPPILRLFTSQVAQP